MGSLPSGAMVSAVSSHHPPCTLVSKSSWVSTAPGHAACRILKGRMTQTNNGLVEALLGLAGAVLVKGRISADAPRGVRPPRSISCMYICLAAVTLCLCGYICVPRQVFSDLFCNKDAQRIAGKCFVLCGTVKDVCSCKIVLGHPSRGDDSDSSKEK